MNQQELRQLIDRAAAEKWTKLNLNGQDLIEMPPEIGQLINLPELYLNRKKTAVQVNGRLYPQNNPCLVQRIKRLSVYA